MRYVEDAINCVSEIAITDFWPVGSELAGLDKKLSISLPIAERHADTDRRSDRAANALPLTEQRTTKEFSGDNCRSVDHKEQCAVRRGFKHPIAARMISLVEG